MSLPESLHPSISYSSWVSERRCFHCRPRPARRTNVHITVLVETTRRSASPCGHECALSFDGHKQIRVMTVTKP